jgi:hypothetical protein
MLTSYVWQPELTYWQNFAAKQAQRALLNRSPQLAFALAFRAIDVATDYDSEKLRRMFSLRTHYNSAKFYKVAGMVGDTVFTCESCARPTWDRFSTEHISGRRYCEECFNERFTYCEHCEGCEWVENMVTIDDASICGRCRELGDFYYCDSCDKWFNGRNTEKVEIDGGYQTVCYSCAGSYYYYCETCDEWHRRGHNHGCDCEASNQEFSLNIAADGVLRNDSRLVITVGGGSMDDQGLLKLQTAICNAGGPWQVLSDEFDMTWQTKLGNLPKRISKAMYAHSGFKATPELLATIGNLAALHVCKSAEHYVELSRDLSPQDNWYHPTGSSCWWSDFSASMCLFKACGGFGIRFFDNGQTDDSNGRAWVMPLRKVTRDVETYNADLGLYVMVPTSTLQPTDDVNAEAYVVFNTYLSRNGDGSDRNKRYPARIMAQLVGMTYRHVGMIVNNEQMYLNGDSFLIADIETLAATSNLNITIDVEVC